MNVLHRQRCRLIQRNCFTLDLEIDRAVKSLDPSRKHSILDEAKIDVRFKGEGGLSVDIRALDAELRRQFEIGKDCWVYADTSELTISDASSIANELTIYIDEKILPTIRDNQGKPLNRLMFSMIFDYVNAQLALLASEEIEKDSLTFADVEEDLFGQICKGWAKQIKVPDLEPSQVFGLVKERPATYCPSCSRGPRCRNTSSTQPTTELSKDMQLPFMTRSQSGHWLKGLTIVWTSKPMSSRVAKRTGGRN